MILYAWTNSDYNATIYSDTPTPTATGHYYLGPWYDGNGNDISNKLNTNYSAIALADSSAVYWVSGGKGDTIPPTSIEAEDRSQYNYYRDTLKDIIYVSKFSDNITTYKLKDDDARNSIANLSIIATTGEYNDLLNKPTIPTTVAELSDSSNYITTNNIVTVNTVTLANVATSGDYADLTNTPTIPPSIVVDQTYTSSSENAISSKALYNAKILRNKTNSTGSVKIVNEDILSATDYTGTSSISIGTSITNVPGNYSVGIGSGVSVTGTNSVGIGYIVSVSGTNAIGIGSGAQAASDSISIGYNARSSLRGTIQIGEGTPAISNSFYVGFRLNSSVANNYQLLDGTTGLIPDARLSTNIARLSDMPTVDQTYNASSTNAQSGVAVAEAISNASSAMIIIDHTR